MTLVLQLVNNVSSPAMGGLTGGLSLEFPRRGRSVIMPLLLLFLASKQNSCCFNKRDDSTLKYYKPMCYEIVKKSEENDFRNIENALMLIN